MKYGYFSEDNREYIITRPDTPTPWMNYISNPRGYCGIVSQSGGGFSFHKDPRERRITKYRYNNIPVDRPGRYFYIRDMDTGDYFSPTWQPVMKKPDNYLCRHGQGYSIISGKYNAIASSVLYFVPGDYDCEIWRLSLENLSGIKRRLSIFSYSEFTLWSEPESRNIQWSLHLPRASFSMDMVFYNFIEPHPAFDMEANKDYQGDRPGFAFMGMSREVWDFDCDRDVFIGMYHSESDPVGVAAGKLSGSILRGGVGCGALRTQITLQPGEKQELAVVLGFAGTVDEAVTIRNRFSVPGEVDKAFKAVKDSWGGYLDSFALESPDKEVNTMVNVWNAYQCKTTFDWSRYISFYENGEGRGMGTRDSCQDTLSVVNQLPGRVKKRIREILSTCQFESGDCYHQFFPLGQKGDLKGFSDDHLWIPQMVYAYIAETGDVGLLDENISYADSSKSAPVYRHILDALDYTARMTGVHGLPLILTADWNDTLHLWMEADKPESVLTACFYVYALKLTARLALFTGRSKDGKALLARASKMAELVNEVAWDGEWYLRGFGSEVIGSSESKRAKIFLNTQVWSIIAGIANKERALVCMDSVRRHLASPEGVKLLWPVFDAYDQTYGLISRYNKGRKENGIFAHANAWAIVAEALLGRGDIAFEYYKNMLPAGKNDEADILKTEPYVYCQTVGSDDSLNMGEGANSWLTGTASWMYVAATQYLLGIKPALGGLEITPCVPADWGSFKVERAFRGCRYRIEFKRTGSRRIAVDGEVIDGNVVPPVEKDVVDVLVEY